MASRSCSNQPNGEDKPHKRSTLARLASLPLIALIKGYQYGISPLLGPRCRFWPSCSHYALEALQVHGPVRGGWLAVKRLAKCNPWHAGGIDPVPGGTSEALCQEDDSLDAHFCPRQDEQGRSSGR